MEYNSDTQIYTYDYGNAPNLRCILCSCIITGFDKAYVRSLTNEYVVESKKLCRGCKKYTSEIKAAHKHENNYN